MALLGTLGSLNVLLSADTAQFSSAMDKAAFVAERDLQRISAKAKLNSTMIIAAFVAAGTAIAVSVKKTIDHADQIGEMAQSLGMTAEQLSSLEYAAKLSGVEIEGLSTSFQKFNNAIFNGAKGVKENVAAFNSLGITVTDNNGRLKSNYDLFLETADALSKMHDGVQKSATAQLLFGKSGAQMIPILNSGKDGIKKLAEEAAGFGVVLSSDLAAAADKFNDNMKRMASVSQGLITSFTSGFIPTMANLTDNIKSSTTALEGFREAGKWTAMVMVGVVDVLLTEASALNTLIKTVMAYKEIKSDVFAGKFKEAGEAAKNYIKDMGKIWGDYGANIKKTLDAISDTVTAGTVSMGNGADSTAEKLAKLAEGKTLTDSLRTAQEKYNDEMAKYNDLLAAGAINQETFDRAAKKAKDTLDKSAESTNKMKNAAKDLGFTFRSAFEDAIIEGKKLSEVLSSLLKDIERIIIRKAITEPLGGAISDFFSPAKTTSAHGNVFSGNRLVPFLEGGLITHPTLFPMADGGMGLAGEAGTEAIMPLFRTGSGDLGVKSTGNGGVEINVYAPEGSNVKTDRQKIGDREQINIIIDEAVAGSVSSPSSKTYRALKNSFGLKQSLTVR